MSEDQHPPEGTEPTRGDSPDPDSGSGRTIRQGGGQPNDGLPGKRIGDFELLGELGRGGMGVVYEARQLSLNRRVALKVLPPGLGLTPQAVQRFEREAQAAAKLHHTNIVPVHATGEEQGCHYYAMELIEGQPLSEILKDLSGAGSNPLMDRTVTQLGGDEAAGPEPDATASTPSITSFSDSSAGSRKWFDVVAKLVSEVADALHYAHGRGVIHRDIKPANLMLSRDGRLCVTDFGLARVAQEPGMTVSGSLVGTPAYMSPEQITAGRVKLDHRTDIYSLGAVLYEMLAHRRPFPGESREEILSGILTKDPRPPRRFNPRIPLDLETICLKAMEKDPDRRYQSAGAFANDLRQFLQRGLIDARRASLPRRVGKSMRRHPVTTTVAAGALVVVAALAIGWIFGGRTQAAQRMVADARLALREGTYRQGLELIDRAVEILPGDIEARLLRAQLLMMNWRTREAADEAHRVLETEPDNWTAHALLAAIGSWSSRYGLPSIPVEEHLRVIESNAPETATAYYLRAMIAESLRERLELLDRALELEPGDSVALVARSNALGGLKDYDGRASNYQRLITARPRSAQGWRFKAGHHRDLGDLEQARAAMAKAMEIDDEDPWNYIESSWIHRDGGDLEGAVEEITRAITLEPRHGHLYYIRAEHLNKLGRFEEAAADARRSIDLAPEYTWAYQQLLTAYTNLDRKDSVRQVVEELRREADTWADDKARSEAYLRVAQWLRQLGDHEEALTAIDLAIELHPDPYDYVTRKDIHRDLGDHDAAEADCDAVADVQVPDEPQALSNRGWALRNCDRQEAALRDFTRAIELAPQWPDPFRGRGHSYFFLKRYEEALADLTRAVELNPNDAGNWNDRNVVLVYLRRFDEGTADLERALELRPQNTSFINNLGAVYGRRGRLQDAIEQRERGIEIAPRDAFNLSVLASHYLVTGRFEDAIEAAQRSIEIDPDAWSGGAHYTLVSADLRLGRRDEARATVEALLSRAEGWKPETASGANVRAAWLYLALDDVEAASGAAARAVEIDPENYAAWIGSGVVRLRLGETAGWKADCRKGAAVELKTANEFLYRSAWLGRLCGLWDAARRDAEHAIEIAPGDPAALLRLGEALEATGRMSDATAALDRALQSDPRDRWALVARARHHAVSGDCAAAAEDLGRAMEAGAQDPRVWGGVAWIRAVLKARNCSDDYEGTEVLELARRAVESSAWVEQFVGEYEEVFQTVYPDVLGYGLLRAGEFAEARDAFEQALRSRLVEDAADLFGLAMAQAGLGDEAAARETYARAVARMQESAPRWPVLIQLRDEAAEVIGVEP